VQNLQQSNNKIREYIDSVCNQIRWKRTHAYISNELENHIVDQKKAFIADGLDEDAALEKAIVEMGDPIGVGTELNRIHKPKMEWSIVFFTGIALLLGLIINVVISMDTDMEYTIGKVIFYSLLGIGFMIAAYYLDYTIIGKHPNILFFVFLIIALGFTIISPHYQSRVFYTKFILLLYPTIYTGIIYSMRKNGYLGLVLCGAFMIISYVVFTPFSLYSIYILYSLLCLILITISILKGWFNINKIIGLLLVYIPTIAVVIMTLLNNQYLWIRFNNLLNPNLDPLGYGWSSLLAREIISNAKFIGEGLGSNSGYMVPAINTDFSITYLVHRFGWISLILIVAVLALLIIKSFKLCLKQSSVLGSLVSTSVLLTFSMQVVIYIAYNLGFQLIAPLTLPLISYGGVGTIINMFLIGIMLSVFKWDNLINDDVLISSGKRLFNYTDGKIIIDFKSLSL